MHRGARRPAIKSLSSRADFLFVPERKTKNTNNAKNTWRKYLKKKKTQRRKNPSFGEFRMPARPNDVSAGNATRLRAGVNEEFRENYPEFCAASVVGGGFGKLEEKLIAGKFNRCGVGFVNDLTLR